MSKFTKSLLLKLHKLTFKFSFLSYFSRFIDKSKEINIDQLCNYYPKNTIFIQKREKSEQAFNSLFDNIHVNTKEFYIPKIIWIYWDKGLNNAPNVVKTAYQSWKSMNPDYDIRFLDETNVQKYFDFKSLFFRLTIDIGIAHKSDFIRMYLLSRYGGVWVDSTTFCWKPLSQWINTETEECGFFLFKQDISRKDRQIKNWFIASSRGNPITVSMLKYLSEYNFRPRAMTLSITKFKKIKDLPQISREGSGKELLDIIESWGEYPYFYFHYLFNEVVKKGIEKSLWNKAKNKINNHTNAHGEINDAYVSKQNYRPKYMSSNTYQKRVEKLFQQIKLYSQDI